GPRLAWAVEGTRAHGLGLTRYLHARGQQVIEASRPPRASKRPGGKSDPADAAAAARGALAAGKHAQPRADGPREALRILLAARPDPDHRRPPRRSQHLQSPDPGRTRPPAPAPARPVHTTPGRPLRHPAGPPQPPNRRTSAARRTAPPGHPHPRLGPRPAR